MRTKRFFSVFVMLAMLLACMPAMPASAAASIAIGEYLEMGTYYGEPILWRCVDIDENGPLMLSDKIICLKPFDAWGDDTSGSHGRSLSNGHYRQQFGSNYWGDSNMRSWLNSNESEGSVTWLCGNPPDEVHVDCNSYANEAGFKTNFTSYELGVIKTVTQDSLLCSQEYSNILDYGSTYHKYGDRISTVVQNAKSTAYREQIEDEFFLLDVNQVKAVFDNSTVLGSNYFVGEPTASAIANSEYTGSSLKVGTKYRSWLRSPTAMYGYFGHDWGSGGNVRIVTVLTSYSDPYWVTDARAFYGSYGVRPAFYLNTATASFTSGSGTEIDPYRVTSSANTSFFENIYRAEYLLNSQLGSTMEGTYFGTNTPGNTLYSYGKENGMDGAAGAWSMLMNTLDVIDSPSNIADYAFEEKDMYESVIMSLFESSVDYKLMGYINNNITKETKNLVSTVTSEMETLYEFDTVSNMDFSDWKDWEKETAADVITTFYKTEHADAAAVAKVTSFIGTAIKYAQDFQSLCETIAAYYNICQLNNSMQQIMREMYNSADNLALKAALADCISVMNLSETEFAAAMSTRVLGLTGKNVAQAAVDKLWSSVKTNFSVAHPAAFAMKAAYTASKYVTGVCFNSDKIEESYCKLEAINNVEEIMRDVYSDIKERYINSPSETNADLYNSAVSVMFNAFDTDCEYALGFVKAVDGALASKAAALFGSTTLSEVETKIKNIQRSAKIMYEDVQTAWIRQLEAEDNSAYSEYAHLLDESNERLNKIYNINCPVDIYLSDANGHLVGYVEGRKAATFDDPSITLAVDGDKKTVYMYGDEEYDIEYVGNDTGTMDITVTEYNNEAESRKVYFNNIELADDLTYTSNDTASSAYSLNKSGTQINADYDSESTSGSTHTATIKRGYFVSGMAVSNELQAGENAEIAAYIPDGYEFAGWSSDVGENIFSDSNSILTTIYMPDCDVNIRANIAVDSHAFATSADSGYYAETADSAEKVGVISFNSIFDSDENYTVNIAGYGINLYKNGDEDNVKTLSSNSETEITSGAVKFYATVENIPSTDFDTPISAVPHVVIDGETYTGSVCVYTVTQGGKWLGVKID